MAPGAILLAPVTNHNLCICMMISMPATRETRWRGGGPLTATAPASRPPAVRAGGAVDDALGYPKVHSVTEHVQVDAAL